MKWIKYKVLQTTTSEGKVFIEKKIGHNETNLAIAESEAYNGQYTIVEDGKPEPSVVTLDDVVDMIGDVGAILDEINGEVV